MLMRENPYDFVKKGKPAEKPREDEAPPAEKDD
jgi:hypothetical protein